MKKIEEAKQPNMFLARFSQTALDIFFDFWKKGSCDGADACMYVYCVLHRCKVIAFMVRRVLTLVQLGIGTVHLSA